MQKLTELVVCLIVMFDVSNQVSETIMQEQRTFINHVDYKTKSCGHGYLGDVDYIIITGFTNVTDIGNPPWAGEISAVYLARNGWAPIPGTLSDLRTEACTRVEQLPPSSCRCLERDDMIIRIKCNITMKDYYSFQYLWLCYHSYHYFYSNPTELLPNVYRDTLCGKSNCVCSVNQGSSLLGGGYAMSGIATIFTALFITVSSLFSFGQ